METIPPLVPLTDTPPNLVRSLILLGFGLTLLLLAIYRLKKYRLKERYALLFAFIGLPFVVLAVYPGAVGWASVTLKIDHGSILLMCVSSFLFLIVFELSCIVSRQDDRINTLAQMVGILQQEARDAQVKARNAETGGVASGK